MTDERARLAQTQIKPMSQDEYQARLNGDAAAIRVIDELRRQLSALSAEAETLREENERLEKLQAANEGRVKSIVDEELLRRAEAAEADLAKARKDAERYQWLQQDGKRQSEIVECYRGEEMSRLIDAALKGTL